MGLIQKIIFKLESKKSCLENEVETMGRGGKK